jgi:hypothetical protein
MLRLRGAARAPSVIQTANGLQQVNINKPATAAGVSVNTYSQFNVPQGGVVLNNSKGVFGVGGGAAAGQTQCTQTSHCVIN